MNKRLFLCLMLAGTSFVAAHEAMAQAQSRNVGEMRKISAVNPLVLKVQADRANAQVVSSRVLNSDLTLQVCKDAQGHMFKRIVGVRPVNNKVDAGRYAAVRLSEDQVLLSESFEGSDGSNEWLPAGWERTSTEGLEYYQSWFVTKHNSNTPSAADGDYFAEIIYSSAKAQDEWLITPAVQVQENQVLSFYSYYDPASLFDLSSECVDWVNQVFKEKRVSATLQVQVSVDGGEWTLLKDFYDDYKDMSLADLMAISSANMSLTKTTLNVGAYAGHTAKFAFRYVGVDGNSMFIDDVRIGLPQLEASYAVPAGTMFWSFDKTWSVLPASILMEPVYVPLTWANTTNHADVSCIWEYTDPETGEDATYNGENLTVTYKPDYTSESTTRNNFKSLPLLNASAPGTSDGSYIAPYDLLQAGGRADMLTEEEEMVTFGLATCDWLADGMTIMTVETDDPMEVSTPIFGHNDKTTEWWTNHFFEGEPDDDNKAEVDGIINFFNAPASPMVIHGLWLTAKGQVGENVEFTAAVYPLDDGFCPSEEPIAVATCKGSDVDVQEGGMQNFLTVPFVFDQPLVVSNKDFDYYIVKVSGFNSDEVTYFAPLQSALPDANGMCYGWLDVKITNGGNVRSTMVPIANFDGDMGPCYNSFFINLDATYPWLYGSEDTFKAQPEGGVKEFALDSYYEASELSVVADTPDGTLPEWLDVKAEGRYGNAKVTFTVAPVTNAVGSCDVTLSAPGVSKVFHIGQGVPAGIGSVEGNAGEGKVEGIYNVLGQRVNGMDRLGNVYIIRYTDGTTRKIVR